MRDERTGGCLCGAVRNRADGTMRPVIVCHREPCRGTSGDAAAATSAPRGAGTVTGAVAWHARGGAARRGFCPACGWSLLRDGPGANLSIMAGSLDLPTGLALAGHAFCEGRGDWDALPRGERQAPGADPILAMQVPG